MPQLLLFPDPRPLLERLGAEFFRCAPETPGVYLMRDQVETVLYVGKAKNLRKRLASYRVANPDRLRRRHLRLLHAVRRIDLEECADETSALARESELLLQLRPRFNRAGTWRGPPRFLCWRLTANAVEFGISPGVQTGWDNGPAGPGAVPFRAALVRLLWCALHADRGLAGLPEGWFYGRHSEPVRIPFAKTSSLALENLRVVLKQLFSGNPGPFIALVRERTVHQTHPFETAVRESDLETVALPQAPPSSLCAINRLRFTRADDHPGPATRGDLHLDGC